jgi:hypothetical protein
VLVQGLSMTFVNAVEFLRLTVEPATKNDAYIEREQLSQL